MTDAEKREKVISDVICAFAEWENNLCCPGEDWSDVHQSRDMVIALLKAQEPCVMKVGDVRSWVNSDRTAREPVIIEMRNGVCAWIVDDEVRELKGAEDLTSELYGKTWRCWTSRPSDWQRKEIPWE